MSVYNIWTGWCFSNILSLIVYYNKNVISSEGITIDFWGEK